MIKFDQAWANQCLKIGNTYCTFMKCEFFGALLEKSNFLLKTNKPGMCIQNWIQIFWFRRKTRLTEHFLWARYNKQNKYNKCMCCIQSHSGESSNLFSLFAVKRKTWGIKHVANDNSVPSVVAWHGDIRTEKCQACVTRSHQSWLTPRAIV